MAESSSTWMKQATIPSDPDEGRKVLEEILEALRSKTWDEEDVFAVHLAVEEALVNAIKHGNQLDPDKTVAIDCEVTTDRVTIRITDEGPGFVPSEIPDPTLEENLECPSGRGLMLMRSFMSRIIHNERGNSVLMEKTRTA